MSDPLVNFGPSALRITLHLVQHVLVLEPPPPVNVCVGRPCHWPGCLRAWSSIPWLVEAVVIETLSVSGGNANVANVQQPHPHVVQVLQLIISPDVPVDGPQSFQSVIYPR
jgi:hypothetical protein